MKKWTKVATPVAANAAFIAWYAFRPERLVVNRHVDEALPTAQSGSSPQPLVSGQFYSSPKFRPNEKSCNPPARAAGQNYLTIGRALERLGVFEPRAELRRKPAGKSNPFARCAGPYY